jgi:hypothetical protein
MNTGNVKTKVCKECGVGLEVGVNWYASMKKNSTFVCKTHHKKDTKKYRDENPKRYDKLITNNRKSIPAGVYEILYKGVRVYVGESQQPYKRTSDHFTKLKNIEHAKLVSPVSYRLSIGKIKRKDLSYNILEYIDDEDTRLQVEQRYIDESTGLWNKVRN